MSTNFFSLTTHGLEQVSVREIAAIPGVKVKQVSYRRIMASCSGTLVQLLGLRTVDDVFLDLGEWSGITRQRTALARLSDICHHLSLRAAAAKCVVLRAIAKPPTFSVTVSFVGKRNYNTAEIKQVCVEGIAASRSWLYTDDDALADLNVRVFIEHETALIGVRLGKKPLHERAYKQAHLAGSLKPPIAVAMLSLVKILPGQKLLDPCCGTGTILIEAGKFGAIVEGGDANRAAVDAARLNIKASGVDACVREWDARALPLPNGSVNRIVSNLPWGRQIRINTDMASFYSEVCAELRRVLSHNGRIALLTNVPHFVMFNDLHCDRKIEISLFGQRPTILTFTT